MAEMITVLLPVFNGQDTIAESLESVLAQTYRDFHVLVLDDGSTDRTAEIVADFARRDSRIQHVHKANSGLVDTLNLGLEMNRSEFIARQDADDLSRPDRFETQLRILRESPDVVAVSGGHLHINGAGDVTGEGFVYENPTDSDFVLMPHREPYLPHPFLMVRKSAMDAVGGGYRHVVHSEDTDLYWRLRDVGNLVNTRQILGSYRVHENSISANSIKSGRIQAVYSQMAGLSAIRRWTGQPDIEFPPGALEHLKGLTTLAEIADFASAGLSDAERANLRGCAAAKLLELLTFRKYLPDEADIRFIRKNLRSRNGLYDSYRKSKRELGKRQMYMVRRLWNEGQKPLAARTYIRLFRNIVLRRRRSRR
ncbi:Glycosyl transferase family 2 [Faunimonas pinastri]|uniref:Glycosyl transferase family 2 n=1 Tax=Faunimonas pinastri TaxID=1855383 RepID=A0A1H9CNB2_9HYPH|nr:glycosyltransferase family A protein [Faunimonas pinastri]SEQ02690.1 Glycosyl transferase family 2 [Faunimonas pinastri]